MKIEEGDNVLHPKYGSGEVATDYGDGTCVCEFARRTERVEFDELTIAPELLNNVSVNESPEWADEPYDEDEPLLYNGAVRIQLELNDSVDFDVDVVEEHNELYIQYWLDYDPTEENDD